MSDVSDFDFWMGDWKVQNRRLRERLAGSDEWEEFEAESKAWPILGGLGNDHVQGQADPRPLHVVAGDDAEPALGAGVLGRRRRELGDELGQRLHTQRR